MAQNNAESVQAPLASEDDDDQQQPVLRLGADCAFMSTVSGMYLQRAARRQHKEAV